MADISDTLAALDLSPENIAEQVQALRNHADERQRKGWLTSAHNLRVGADYMEALSNELAAYRTGQLVPVPSVERVARALARSDQCYEYDHTGKLADWHIRRATAVIAAMQTTD